jgi:hypothetical protein
MIRLLVSGLLVIASLSLVVQHPVSDRVGSEDGQGQLLLATTAGSVPFIVGKTSQTIQLARKQIGKDSGPDKASKIPVTGNFPIPDEGSGLAAHQGYSGYDPVHILFRSGARSISPRAPPRHYSV